MRNVIAIVVGVAALLGLMFGLNWLGVISRDAAAIGFVTGLVVGAVLTFASRKKGSTG
jgi:membrane associated rhomboid family serine protease